MSTLTPQSILLRVYEDIANTRLLTARLLMSLSQEAKSIGVKNIDWTVDKGGAEATVEAINSNGQNTATDAVLPASLPIASYRVKHQFTLSKVDVVQAMNAAPSALSDLFGAHVRRGVTQILRRTNQLFYSGTGVANDAQIFGLEYAADNTLNYAGISPVDEPSWTALKNTNGSNRALTKNLLMNIDKLVNENESYYDLIVVNPAVGLKYNEVFDLYTAGGVLTLPDENKQGLTRVDLGYSSRTYQGVPIVEDPMCPNNKMYFLNTMDVNPFSFNLDTDATLAGAEGEMPLSIFGLNIYMGELPSMNTAARTFEIFTLPQLRVFNRKSICVLDNLTA